MTREFNDKFQKPIPEEERVPFEEGLLRIAGELFRESVLTHSVKRLFSPEAAHVAARTAGLHAFARLHDDTGNKYDAIESC